MAQLRILGPVIYYSLRPGRVSEIVRVDPAQATAVLEILGHSPAVAVLIANHALDGAAAKRLGTALGLLTTCQEEVITADEVGLVT